MKRNIVNIDEEKCNGCGACAGACHEGAIEMVNGKARLIRDDYCDGLGACLPACPADAITIIEREAAPFDEKLVNEKKAAPKKEEPACGCAGMTPRTMERRGIRELFSKKHETERESCLRQWPVQIKLVSVNAEYFKNAHILVAADCTAYAYAGFHERFMDGRVTLIGCPKLDDTDYSEKLGEIFMRNDVKSVTVLRMEVPCCGGMENAVKAAVRKSGKDIPVRVVTVSIDGKLLD